MGEKLFPARILGRLYSSSSISNRSIALGRNTLVCSHVYSFSPRRNQMRYCIQEHLTYSRYHYASVRLFSKISDGARSVMHFYEFTEIKEKNKDNFEELISLYDKKFPQRKGVVDFIYSALKFMKEFGVHEDLETYKKLLDLMPKEKYVPKNIIQAEFMHFPREQDCILELLSQMEENGVIPDVEMGDMLKNIFGKRGLPTKKFFRMMYWMPKFKYKSPWYVKKPVPTDPFTLAQLAIQRITSVDLQTEISVFRTEDIEASIDKTWIVSGQSPTQKKLLEKHDPSKSVIVEGGDHVWIREHRVNYFTLKSHDIPYVHKEPVSNDDLSGLDVKYLNPNYKELEEEQSVHEQEDGIIYAVCATGTSEKDSLLSWIRLLEKNGNPVLENLAVLFRFKKAPDQPVPYVDSVTTRSDSTGEAVKQ